MVNLRWTSLLAIYSIASLVSGQSTSLSDPSSTSVSAAATVTRVVKVGEADHKMEPDVTRANVGDIIEFHFFPPNHSVVQAK